MSPELLDPPSFGLEKSPPTKESDCYALGMVIYEVLSGKTPFAPLQTPMIMKKVLERVRPERPQGEEGRLFTDNIWRTMDQCWAHEPAERISAEEVLLGLGGELSLFSTSVAVGGDTTVDVDDQWDIASNYSGTFFGLVNSLRSRSAISVAWQAIMGPSMRYHRMTFHGTDRLVHSAQWLRTLRSLGFR